MHDALTFGVASCAPAAANTLTLCPFLVDAASGAVSAAFFTGAGVIMFDRAATYSPAWTVALNVYGARQRLASVLVERADEARGGARQSLPLCPPLPLRRSPLRRR